MIKQAKQEILISYYIIEEDGIGLFILDELIKAKRRNGDLNILILVDGSANGLSEEMMYYLGQSGINVKEYNPLPKIFMPLSHISFSAFFKAIKNLNNRMHDKLFIIDRKYLLTGGRNIKNSYYGIDQQNFRDSDIFVHSKALGQSAAEYFLKMWRSENTKGLCPVIDYSSNTDYLKTINAFKAIQNFKSNHWRYDSLLSEADQFYQNLHPVDTITFLHGFCEINGEIEPRLLHESLLDILEKTQSRLLIETPYLLCTDDMFDLLQKKANQGVEITIITNSFCSTDLVAVSGAYDNFKAELLSIGINLFEYCGKEHLHSKTFIVDDQIALVGSYNMDPRSASTNTEVMLFFGGKEAIEQLETSIYETKDLSVKVKMEKDKVLKTCQNCERTLWEYIQYLLFRLLSNFKIIYNLL